MCATRIDHRREVGRPVLSSTGRAPVTVWCLFVALAASPVAAQSRYALIGTDAQAAGPRPWSGDASRGERFAAIMEAWAADDGFRGTVLASFDGEVVYRAAFGTAEDGSPLTLATPMRAGFLSSYFTAAAVGILADTGRLSLDDATGDHLPGCRADIASMPIRHLLAMRGGLQEDLFGVTEKSFRGPFSRGELLDLVNSLERVAPAGDRFAFSGPDGSQPDMILAGLLVEAVSGIAFEDFVTRHVIAPVGLSATRFLSRIDGTALPATHHELFGEVEPYEYPDPGYLFASGALVTTVDDLHRFFTAVVDETALGDAVRRAIELRSGPVEFAIVDGALRIGDGIPRDATVWRTSGDNGWIRGETVLYQHFLGDGDMVLVLSNVHRSSCIYDIRRRYTRVKYGLPVGVPVTGAARELWRILLDEGVDAAERHLRSANERGAGADLPWPDQFMHHSRELRGRGRLDEALLVTELYLRVDPDFYLPYREMGEVYRSLGEREKAVGMFKHALARDPDHPIWKREMERFVVESGGD